MVTDTSWRFTYRPLLKNDVYIGVTYDAGNEIKAGRCLILTPARGTIHCRAGTPADSYKSIFPPIQVTLEINPKTIYSPAPGIWMVDMGNQFYRHLPDQNKRSDRGHHLHAIWKRIYEDGTLNPMTAVAGQIKRKAWAVRALQTSPGKRTTTSSANPERPGSRRSSPITHTGIWRSEDLLSQPLRKISGLYPFECEERQPLFHRISFAGIRSRDHGKNFSGQPGWCAIRRTRPGKNLVMAAI